MSEPTDVLVVTALKLERLAVRAHLTDVEVERDSRLAGDIGLFKAGGRDVRVAVLQTGAGNVAAAIQTTRAEEFFRPGIVLMMGIAGGLKDVSIGDVVAAQKVYWTEAGKDAEKWHARIDVAPVSDSLRQVAHAIAADDAWRARLPDERRPESFVAPIAAGEKVLANSRSELVKRIRHDCSDAVCVDMEDYGTLRAGASTERARTLAIRGISDLLDNKGEVEKEGSHKKAAENAAAFTFELIARAQPVDAGPGTQGEFAALFAALYPEGPQQRAIWERAGGDTAGLELHGTGRERWWRAVGLVQRGGGPALTDLLDEMVSDFPENKALRAARLQT